GGGYGVMQQRSAMQEEIRDLRAQLATAANPAEVTSSRDAQRELIESNAELESKLNLLTLENRQLSDTTEGLQGQLEAQRLAAITLEEARAAARKQSALRSSVAAVPGAAPAAASTAPTPEPSGKSGAWFVNFGSYSQQPVASDWAMRLQKTYDQVVVAPASANGKTVYRVRVIDVTSKARADEISIQLQEQYNLPTLWVGRQ
ncbi:MAG: cell division septation protein DedD, partial [Halieaceae bacterium]